MATPVAGRPVWWRRVLILAVVIILLISFSRPLSLQAPAMVTAAVHKSASSDSSAPSQARASFDPDGRSKILHTKNLEDWIRWFPSCLESPRRRLQMQNPFEKIYKNQLWGQSGHDAFGGSLSGPDSVFGAKRISCKVLGATLARFAEESGKKVISILDAPVGDFFWMPHCLQEILNSTSMQGLTIEYDGADVSQIAVERAGKRQKHYAAELPRVKFGTFQQLDLTIPKSIVERFGKHFDIVLSNDALMHISDKYVKAILRNFNNAGTNYLVVNSYCKAPRNRDISMDMKPFPFRRLDLTTKPWAFEPVCGDEEDHRKIDRNDQGEFMVTFKLPLSESPLE